VLVRIQSWALLLKALTALAFRAFLVLEHLKQSFLGFKIVPKF